MSFIELAKSRYSVRSFSDKPVEEEKLEEILEAGRIAPTAKNMHPEKIYVLRSEEAMNKAKELTRCTYGASTVLLVCYDEEIAWHSNTRVGYISGEMDASIVTTHMMLRAWELGIGSCWVGLFNDKEVSAAFSLPENIKPVALMPLGYPTEDCVPREGMHLCPRPVEETIAYL